MTPHDPASSGSVARRRAELHFHPRIDHLPCLAFPCDGAGKVEIDRLGEHERTRYLFARALRGRAYSHAIVMLPTSDMP